MSTVLCRKIFLHTKFRATFLGCVVKYQRDSWNFLQLPPLRCFYGALLIASTRSSSAFTTRLTETLLVRGLLGRLLCCSFAAVIRKPKVKWIRRRRVRSALLIEILFRCLWGALMMMPRCVSLFALCGRKMKWSKLCVCSRNSARASI